MATRGKLYDAVVNAGKAALSLFRVQTARREGERRMSAMTGTWGVNGGWGMAQWDSYTQIQQYKNWVYKCVDFLAINTRQPPDIVKMVGSADRNAYNHAQKAYKSGAVGEQPQFRKFLSHVSKKSAVGQIREHHEYEFLPDDHPAVRLVNDPNEPFTGIKFWQYVSMYEELTGQSFIWKVPDASGRIVELWCIPSQWITPRATGHERFVDYYECRPIGGPIQYFDPAEIIWNKADSPWHPLAAQSPTQAAATTIDAYQMVETSRYSAMETGVTNRGVFTTPADVSLSQQAVDRLETRLLAKFAGPTNAGRPLILEEGLTWTPPASESELQFRESLDGLRRYIMAHYGLDEAMMGFANFSTYAASVVTDKNLYKRVIAPRLENRAACLTERLLIDFEPGLKAIYLPNSKDEDPDDKRANWQAAMNYKAVTKNEVRQGLLHLEPIDDPSADELPQEMAGFGDMGPLEDEQQAEGFSRFGGSEKSLYELIRPGTNGHAH